MIPTSIHESRRPRLDAGAASNRLLCSLPAEEWSHWQPHLESVELRSGMVLYDTGSPLSHMVFPTTGTVSLIQRTDNGAATECAVVGNDGAVGITLFLGGMSPPGHAIVETCGHGFRVDASTLLERFACSANVQHLMLLYTQSLLTQMAQTAACNKHHSIEQQLCRWLLMRLDRMSGNEIPVTQGVIGSLLGVRRESVTLAARSLQRTGLIQSVRGRAKVLDRHGLESRSCECYAAMRRESERLLPPL